MFLAVCHEPATSSGPPTTIQDARYSFCTNEFDFSHINEYEVRLGKVGWLESLCSAAGRTLCPLGMPQCSQLLRPDVRGDRVHESIAWHRRNREEPPGTAAEPREGLGEMRNRCCGTARNRGRNREFCEEGLGEMANCAGRTVFFIEF